MQSKVQFHFYKFVFDQKLKKETLLKESKMRFMNDVMEEDILIYKQSKQIIITSLRDKQYPFYENNTITEYSEDVQVTTQYNYLLTLPIYNFTLEKVTMLLEEIQEAKDKYTSLEATDSNDIWLRELDEFETEYKQH